MQGILIITIASAALYCYLTVTAIRAKPRKTEHWLLAAAAFSLTFWTFFAYFTYNAENYAQVRLFFFISISGLFLFLPLQNIFVRSLTGKLSWSYILLLSLPALFFAVKNFDGTVTFSDFYRMDGNWVFVPAEGTVWNALWILYFTLAFGAGILYLIGWYRRSDLTREKKQIKLLIISSLTAMCLTVADYLLHNRFLAFRTVSLTPILLAPWGVGYILAIKRYQLLNITPEMVTRRILESIDEQVILVNPEGRPVYMNGKALRFFEKPFRKMESHRFDRFFLQDDEDSMLPALTGDGSVKKKVLLKTLGQEGIPPVLAFEINKVYDRFGDLLGFLLIGKEDRSVEIFVRQFQLTAREADVVAGIVGGLKTRTIAEQLNIAERTVKTHIGNVYRKLGVSTRVDLVNMITRGEEQ